MPADDDGKLILKPALVGVPAVLVVVMLLFSVVVALAVEEMAGLGS